MQAPAMNEAQARFWTTVFAGITAIGLVVGGIYSAVQYFASRAADRDAQAKQALAYNLQVQTAQLEALKTYYSKHLELCHEASVAAATIATTADPQKKNAATENFWRLYWGPLGMVEETGVANAMVAFGKCLQTGKACQQNLPSLSLDLAHGCRAEAAEHFKLNLPAVPPRGRPND
jgi:hypothetical protein